MHENDGCLWCSHGDGRESGTAAVRDGWKFTAFDWLAALPVGAVVTADDLRDQVGDPEKPAAVGAVFQTAFKAGILAAAGYAQSNRKTNHSRVLRRWLRVQPSEA